MTSGDWSGPYDAAPPIDLEKPARPSLNLGDDQVPVTAIGCDAEGHTSTSAVELTVPVGVGRDPGQAVLQVLRRLAPDSRLQVMVIGNYGSGNTGDEAVLAGLAEQLRQDADLTVLSRQPERVTKMHGLPSVSMTTLRGARATLRSDVIAIGGGGMFGKGLPLLVAILPAALLGARVLFRKRIILMSLGVYPDTPSGTLQLLRLVAAMADGVFLRDDRSIATLGRGWFGRRSRPELVGDAGVYLKPACRRDAQRFLESHGVSGDVAPLLISIKPTPDLDLNHHIVEVLAEVASRWVETRQAPVVILPLSEQGDYGLGAGHADAVLGRRVKLASRVSDAITVLPAGLGPRLAKAVVAEAAAVIGVRFHALVFGVTTGRPVLGLVFEHKAAAFLEQVDLQGLAMEGLDAAAVEMWLSDAIGRPPLHRDTPARTSRLPNRSM